MKKNLFLSSSLILCITFISAPAWAYKADLKEARSLVSMGAYEQADKYYTAALTSSKLKGKTRDTVLAEATGIRKKLASSHFEKGKQSQAKGDVAQALNWFNKAVRLDPDNPTYAAHYDEIEHELNVILKEVQAIRESARATGQFDLALQNASKFRTHASYLPSVAKELSGLSQDAAAYYAAASNNLIRSGELESAYHQMALAAKYLPDDVQLGRRKQGRHHLFKATQALLAGNYENAFLSVEKAVGFEPNDPDVRRFYTEFLKQWSAKLYNAAVTAESQNKPGVAREHLVLLTMNNPGYLDAQDLLNSINQNSASLSYSKGRAILDKNDRSRTGLALAYLLLASEQNANLFPSIKDEIADVKRSLLSSVEYRISLVMRNLSAEAGADGQVRDEILNALKNSGGLKHIKVMEREALDDILREQGLGQAFFEESTAVQVKKIKGIHAGLYVDVVKLAAFESGADSPSYGSQRYESGKRTVPNPRYHDLQQELAIAQQELLNAQRETNRTEAQNNQAIAQSQSNPYDKSAAIAGLGAVIGSIGSTMIVREAQDRLNKVQADLRYERPTREEPQFDDIRYEIYDLSLHGEAVLSFKIVNYETSEISDTYSASARNVIRDRYVRGDPAKGVANDPKVLPPPEIFRREMLIRAIDQLLVELGRQLGGASESHYVKAESAASNGLVEDAVDAYVRYLYSTSNLKAAKAQRANEYIYNHLGLSLIQRRKR